MKSKLWWLPFLVRPSYWPWLFALAPWTTMALCVAVGFLIGAVV